MCPLTMTKASQVDRPPYWPLARSATLLSPMKCSNRETMMRSKILPTSLRRQIGLALGGALGAFGVGPPFGIKTNLAIFHWSGKYPLYKHVEKQLASLSIISAGIRLRTIAEMPSGPGAVLAFFFSRTANLTSSGVTAHLFCHLKSMSRSQFIIGSSWPAGNNESKRLSRVALSKVSVRLELDVNFLTMALENPRGPPLPGPRGRSRPYPSLWRISRFNSALDLLYRI